MKIWFFAALVAALGIILVRLYFKVRTVRRSRAETWDEHMIAQLRSQGYAPFNDYRVDFFLALPDETAVQSARARLEPEFTVDAKPLQDRARLQSARHQDHAAHRAGDAGNQPPPDRARRGARRPLRRLGRLRHQRFSVWRLTASAAAAIAAASPR